MMNQKGGDHLLLEMIYRIDERTRAMQKGMDEMGEDIAAIKEKMEEVTKQVAVDKERIDDIKDKMKTARTVSWSSLATAIISFITGK